MTKLPAHIKRHITAHSNAALALAFVGAADPIDRPYIEEYFRDTRATLEKSISNWGDKILLEGMKTREELARNLMAADKTNSSAPSTIVSPGDDK